MRVLPGLAGGPDDRCRAPSPAGRCSAALLATLLRHSVPLKSNTPVRQSHRSALERERGDVVVAAPR